MNGSNLIVRKIIDCVYDNDGLNITLNFPFDVYNKIDCDLNNGRDVYYYIDNDSFNKNSIYRFLFTNNNLNLKLMGIKNWRFDNLDSIIFTSVLKLDGVNNLDLINYLDLLENNVKFYSIKYIINHIDKTSIDGYTFHLYPNDIIIELSKCNLYDILRNITNNIFAYCNGEICRKDFGEIDKVLFNNNEYNINCHNIDGDMVLIQIGSINNTIIDRPIYEN